MKPYVLRADNLTPPTRTPWGGHKILGEYKRGLHEVAGLSGPVGESWEVSVEPSFPSALSSRPELLLRDVIAADPVAWLGSAVARRFGGQTPLLVKLLDAADNLSVQVHPAEGDPGLEPGESGKPESWLIVEVDPGAGIFLGFAPAVTRRDIEDCLADRGRLDELLNFVPVAPGDFFVIAAGTVHAIGAGVTLVEPQLVTPGNTGVTYRFWDWNRLYDAGGLLDPAGKPRPLHVDRSMACSVWEGARGEEFVASCRGTMVVIEDSGLRRTLLTDWSHFRVERLSGTGELALGPATTMTAVTCTQGRATLTVAGGTVTIRAGQSAVLPPDERREVRGEALEAVSVSCHL